MHIATRLNFRTVQLTTALGIMTRPNANERENRNRGTANKYNQIGLPEYFALEAFVKWKGGPI